jgi:cobalt-zinc-cadmium efflux system membrane fusion protein
VISSAGKASSGITLDVAQSAVINSGVSVQGEIIADNNKLARIMPLVRGFIADVRKNIGDKVKKGEVLAIIQSRELAEIKGDYFASKKQFELAESEYKRAQELKDKQIISEQEFLTKRKEYAEAEIQCESAKYRLFALGFTESDLRILNVSSSKLSQYELRSPIDGVVIKRTISQGDAIASEEAMNSAVFTISDISNVMAEFNVPSTDITKIQKGQQVSITNIRTNEVVNAVIQSIDPTTAETSRSVKVRAQIKNNGGVRIGDFLTGTIICSSIKVPVAIPISSLQTFRGWDVVFICSGDTLEARPIQLGMRGSSHVEILTGLNVGDTIVSANSYTVKAELEKSSAAHAH